jgi:hypothetical protein
MTRDGSESDSWWVAVPLPLKFNGWSFGWDVQ